MAKPQEKMRARALRRKGESVKSIAKVLGVSSGSVSAWVRDVALTPAQARKLHERQIQAGHAGRMIGAASNRRQKEERIRKAGEEASVKLPVLTTKSLYFVGLGLYWGEGTKASNGMVSIVNSDPTIIQLMIRWFEECWEIDRSRFHPRVYISDIHRGREQAILAYWTSILGIPQTQFGRTIFLAKGKKIYENHDIYYGVLALRVSKGAELRHRILADIERVRKIGILPA